MPSVTESSPREPVVLIHGLGQPPLAMSYAARRLRQAGFAPHRVTYPSRRQPIERLAETLARRLPQNPDRPLHFLTHSMGGIVLRQLVRVSRPPNLGRSVMLGPPNGGSELAARLTRSPVYGPLWQTMLGPAITQLASGPGCFPSALGPIDFETGVIAGSGGLDPLQVLVSGESDGRVRVSETYADGVTDFFRIRRSHTLLVFDPITIDQAIHFIQHGRFKRTMQKQKPGLLEASLEDS